MREKININYIRNKISEMEPTTTLLSETYIDNRQQLKFLCGCGKEFTKNWSTIQQRKSCKCRSCAQKDGWKNIRKDSDFSIKIKDEYLAHNFIPLEDITHARQRILCKDNDGYKGRISIANVRIGQHFSVFGLKCNGENLLYNLNNYANKTLCGTTVIRYDTYAHKSSSCKIKCRCGCGRYFTTNITNFTTQHKWRCDVCTGRESTLELLTEIELQNNNIYYIRQKTFKDCINPITNYPLRFDFYVPYYNTCIEIDGSQHFDICTFGNISKEKAQTDFKENKFRDKIKDEYCKNHNIRLVRISYKKFYHQNTEYKDIIKHLFN